MPTIAAPVLDTVVTFEVPTVSVGALVSLTSGSWSSGFSSGFGPNSEIALETVVDVPPLSLTIIISPPVIDTIVDFLGPEVSAGVTIEFPVIDFYSEFIAPIVGSGAYVELGFGPFSSSFSPGFGPVQGIIPDTIVELLTPTLSLEVPVEGFDTEIELVLPEVRTGVLISCPIFDTEVELGLDGASAGASIDFPVFDTLVEILSPRLMFLQVIKTSTKTVPSTHLEDSKKLEGDAYIDLFEIELSDKSGKIYLKNNNSVNWQGNTYEGTAIKLDGVSQHSGDENSRPKLSVWNPNGVFSSLVDKGVLDNALIYRIRLLKKDLIEDTPIYRSQQWRVSRVMSLTKHNILLELRNQLDGQFFQVPGRMFIPPEFPQVSLG